MLHDISTHYAQQEVIDKARFTSQDMCNRVNYRFAYTWYNFYVAVHVPCGWYHGLTFC